MKLLNDKTLKSLLTRVLEKLIQIVDKHTQSDSKCVLDDSTHDSTHDSSETPSTPSSPTLDKPSEEEPSFTYESFGNPNCAKAAEDPNTQIKDFRWSRGGMSYRWLSGNLRNWGIADDHDHTGALAIAGYYDGQTWRFAKFDWISSDRLTRSHENIEDHYNGFPSEYFSASKHGFFIMSKDGKLRTNILTV